MKKFIALLILFIVGFCFVKAVRAVEVDVQGGVTQYTKVANGNWYQDGFDHKLTLTSPTAGLLVLSDKDSYGMQYGVGVGNYGEYKVAAKVLDFDANYDDSPNNPTHCHGPCQKLSDIKGWGNIPYAELQARKTFDNGIIIGVSLIDTRASFHVTNYNWQATPPYVQYATQTPIQFTVYHQVVNKYDLGLMVGYHITPALKIELEAVPTHAPNDQAANGVTEITNNGRVYYRLLTKGYSPRVLLEYTVLKF